MDHQAQEQDQKRDQKRDTTDFGFKEIPRAEKSARVADVFRSVADRYDLMNDLMSLGIHRVWKHIAVDFCAVRPGQRILDLAGGSGDLSHRLVKALKGHGQVVLADINEAMLNVGKDRLLDAGLSDQIEFVQADAEQLPFPDHYFDTVIIGFGLRNVTDKAKALKSIHRVLKPGGRLLVLEFSHPKYPWLRKIYDAYSFAVLPKLGKLIADDEDSYRYLAESIRKHPDQLHLKTMMREAGFDDCDYTNLSGGIVAIHRGYKY